MKVLNAFWDLRWFPLNYEIVQWLLMAEIKRRALGCDAIRLIIVPPEGRLAKQHTRSPEIEYWRLWNQVSPVMRLVPSFVGLSILVTRQEAANGKKLSFPDPYDPYSAKPPTRDYKWNLVLAAAEKNILPSLKPGDVALENAREWIENHCLGKKPVVIVQRTDPRHPDRNTNWWAWRRFADRLMRGEQYFPIILRDASDIYSEGPQDFVTFDAASVNVELRAALYQEAYLVMGTMSGNMSLAIFNEKVRYLLLTNPKKDTDIEDFWFTKRGFVPGQQPPLAKAGQRWLWANDDYLAIEEGFRQCWG